MGLGIRYSRLNSHTQWGFSLVSMKLPLIIHSVPHTYPLLWHWGMWYSARWSRSHVLCMSHVVSEGLPWALSDTLETHTAHRHGRRSHWYQTCTGFLSFKNKPSLHPRLFMNMENRKKWRWDWLCIVQPTTGSIFSVYDSCPTHHHQDIYVWYMYLVWCLHCSSEPPGTPTHN